MEYDLNIDTINMIAGLIDKSVGEVVNLTGLKAWTSLIYKTPVGNPDLWKTKYKPKGYVGGQAKFSWNMQYGNPDTTLPTTWGAGLPPTPNIDARDDYKSLYVTSSIPYMEKLEKAPGHSTQGFHMIKRTVGEVQLELKTALR